MIVFLLAFFWSGKLPVYKKVLFVILAVVHSDVTTTKRNVHKRNVYVSVRQLFSTYIFCAVVQV